VEIFAPETGAPLMSITRPAIFFVGAELMIVAVGVETGKFDNGAQAEIATLKIVII